MSLVPNKKMSLIGGDKIWLTFAKEALNIYHNLNLSLSLSLSLSLYLSIYPPPHPLRVEDDNLLILILIALRICLTVDGVWIELALIYVDIALDLLNGL